MKAHLLYTLITICIFIGIGAVIKGLTDTPARPARGSESGKSGGATALTTGILLISAGLLLLYFCNDLLSEW